jgi:ribulose 1,5-bisphosphate synthetase/thiazole synthase
MSVIRVVIKEGKAVVSVEGHEGASCKDLTQRIEDALGTGGELQAKPEFYSNESEGQQQCQ